MPFGSGGGIANVSSIDMAASLADLIDIFNDQGSLVFVDAAGRFGVSEGASGGSLTASVADGLAFRFYNAAPANGTLDTNEIALWFDSTPASTKLMAKGKDSAGTVKTATVATLV